MESKIDTAQVAFHRNGTGGMCFYSVVMEVKVDGTDTWSTFLINVFEDTVSAVRHKQRGLNPYITVHEVSQLPNVQFGQNSWNGPDFLEAAMSAISAYQNQV